MKNVVRGRRRPIREEGDLVRFRCSLSSPPSPARFLLPNHNTVSQSAFNLRSRISVDIMLFTGVTRSFASAAPRRLASKAASSSSASSSSFLSSFVQSSPSSSRSATPSFATTSSVFRSTSSGPSHSRSFSSSAGEPLFLSFLSKVKEIEELTSSSSSPPSFQSLATESSNDPSLELGKSSILISS